MSKFTKEAAVNLSKLKKLNSISLAGIINFDLNAATQITMNKSIRCVALDGVKRISTDVLLKLLININITLIDLNHLQKITKGKLAFEKINKKNRFKFIRNGASGCRCRKLSFKT